MQRDLKSDGFFLTGLRTAIAMNKHLKFTSEYSTMGELLESMASRSLTSIILLSNNEVDEIVSKNHNILSHIVNIYALVTINDQEPMDLNKGITTLELNKVKTTKELYKVNTKHKFIHELMVGLNIIGNELIQAKN